MEISELSIVLVEPSPVQGKLIRAELEKLGICYICEHLTGEEALQELRTAQPDLVISSMYLPDMTGAELVIKIRRDSSLESTPFMLISSETSFAMIDPIKQAGAIAILPKPFNLEDLKRALYATVDFIHPDEHALADLAFDDLKTLVVDDSSMARKHISRVLSNLGIEHISTAENGLDAIEKIESNFFDLIVTDYNMPEMDGEKLTRFIRENSSQQTVPILMVTSEGDSSRLAAVQRAGVSGICDKPFEPEAVKQMIHQLLIA